MKFFLLFLLSLPSAYLFLRFDQRRDIVIEYLITLGLLFIGWKIFRGGFFRLLGLVMLILGLAAYYFLIFQPFYTGKITTFNF